MGQDLAAIETECLKDLQLFRANTRTIYDGLRTSVESAIENGRILNNWKEKLPHGRFIPFIEQYLVIEQLRTYQNWMRAARNFEEISKNEKSSYLNQDANLMQIVHYDKLAPEKNGATPPVSEDEPSPTSVQTTTTTSHYEEVNGDFIEEVEVDEWEYNATHHKSLVDAINAFGRFLDEVMADEESSEYIAHAETRIRADMKQLKGTVWQLMPVGEKRGKIVTRNQKQSRK